MKIRPLFLMIGVAIILSGFMLIQRLITFISSSEKQEGKRVDPNWVEGAALLVGNKPYTLNFDQQLTLLTIINQAETPTASVTGVFPGANKLAIYRFQKEPLIEILPKGSVEGKIVFQATPLNDNQLLIEKERGSLKNLIDSSLDTPPQ